MSALLCTHDPITAVLMDGRCWKTTVGYRTQEGHPVSRDGALTLFPYDEGIFWARGWDTEEADALRTAVALGVLRLV